MQRFSILQPPATHFRAASCNEVECDGYVNGFVTVLDPNLAEHVGLMALLLKSGRHFTQMRSEDAAQQLGKALPGGLQAFVFQPGQHCFEKHLLPVGRDPLFIYDRNGVRRRHHNGLNFNEQMNEESYKVSRFGR